MKNPHTRPGLASLTLAAGRGTRLLPITRTVPKALCPAGPSDRLLSRALRQATTFSSRVAVNTHHLHRQVEQFVAERHPEVTLVVEHQLLGTGGAVGNIRDWMGDEDLLLINADTVLEADVRSFVDDWDGERVRMLVVADESRADFSGVWRYVGICLIPNRLAVAVTEQPANLSEELFMPEWEAQRLELVPVAGFFIDCATPRDLLIANLSLSGGAAVVCDGATLRGTAEASLLMPGATVGADEALSWSIRLADGTTVDLSAGISQ